MADDDQQVYIARDEEREGTEVTGQYSYVDPNGALVVVKYTAGVNGYQETREVQDGFVSIRNAPVAPVAPVAVPVRVPAPAPVRVPVAPVRPVVVTTPAPAPAPVENDDLVARIIAQLQPFIRNTVSSTLANN